MVVVDSLVVGRKCLMVDKYHTRTLAGKIPTVVPDLSGCDQALQNETSSHEKRPKQLRELSCRVGIGGFRLFRPAGEVVNAR